jgi:hypothetical protein
MEHWKKYLPRRYASLQNPLEFFETLGEELADEITDLSLTLAGDDPPAENFMAKLGRLNMAKSNAESQILRERALLPPEDETETEML